MESKIRIKLGPIEVEFEGSEQFLKNELPDLIKTVSELHKASNIYAETPTDDTTTDESGKGIQLSTGSIAAKLTCKTGPELAVAAAAHLTLVKKTKVFSRKVLLGEMKTASSYYKSSYGNNFSNILSALLKSKFNEPSTGNYALTAKAKEEVRSRLA